MNIDDLSADIIHHIENKVAPLSPSEYRDLLATLIETLQEREEAARADADREAGR